jgi:hypothetical protein
MLRRMARLVQHQPILVAMFQIRDILILIRTLGSVHWISEQDPAFIVSGFQDANKYFHFIFSFCRYINISLHSLHVSEKSLNSRNHSSS